MVDSMVDCLDFQVDVLLVSAFSDASSKRILLKLTGQLTRILLARMKGQHLIFIILYIYILI
jgi:hypothetical protein